VYTSDDPFSANARVAYPFPFTEAAEELTQRDSGTPKPKTRVQMPGNTSVIFVLEHYRICKHDGRPRIDEPLARGGVLDEDSIKSIKKRTQDVYERMARVVSCE
jgi:hypothetical protein